MVALVFMVELKTVPAGRSRRICLVDPVIVKFVVVAAEANGVRQMVMSRMVKMVAIFVFCTVSPRGWLLCDGGCY
jgi:hypothetical protein